MTSHELPWFGRRQDIQLDVNRDGICAVCTSLKTTERDRRLRWRCRRACPEWSELSARSRPVACRCAVSTRIRRNTCEDMQSRIEDRDRPALRVLVSGAAGFIGSHLCDRLLADGCEVVAIDNLSTGRASNLAHLHSRRSFSFVVHDVCEPPETIDGSFDAVFNLASPASPKDYAAAPIETLLAGSLGTRNMLEVARRTSATFVQASTSETYGDPLQHPQSEDYWGNVNPVGPRSVYDESKRFAEALTTAYHRRHGVETRLARLFNTYGPRMKRGDGRVLPAFLEQAFDGEPLTVFGDGTQTRSFCYVSDIVDGLLLLCQSHDSSPVNLGSPTEITVLDLARQVLEMAGSSSGIRRLPLPQDDPRRRRPDIGKARKLLGWAPKVPLVAGLQMTIDWFRAEAR